MNSIINNEPEPCSSGRTDIKLNRCGRRSPETWDFSSQQTRPVNEAAVPPCQQLLQQVECNKGGFSQR